MKEEENTSSSEYQTALLALDLQGLIERCEFELGTALEETYKFYDDLIKEQPGVIKQLLTDWTKVKVVQAGSGMVKSLVQLISGSDAVADLSKTSIYALSAIYFFIKKKGEATLLTEARKFINKFDGHKNKREELFKAIAKHISSRFLFTLIYLQQFSEFSVETRENNFTLFHNFLSIAIIDCIFDIDIKSLKSIEKILEQINKKLLPAAGSDIYRDKLLFIFNSSIDFKLLKDRKITLEQLVRYSMAITEEGELGWKPSKNFPFFPPQILNEKLYSLLAYQRFRSENFEKNSLQHHNSFQFSSELSRVLIADYRCAIVFNFKKMTFWEEIKQKLSDINSTNPVKLSLSECENQYELLSLIHFIDSRVNLHLFLENTHSKEERKILSELLSECARATFVLFFQLIKSMANKPQDYLIYEAIARFFEIEKDWLSSLRGYLSLKYDKSKPFLDLSEIDSRLTWLETLYVTEIKVHKEKIEEIKDEKLCVQAINNYFANRIPAVIDSIKDKESEILNKIFEIIFRAKSKLDASVLKTIAYQTYLFNWANFLISLDIRQFAHYLSTTEAFDFHRQYDGIHTFIECLKYKIGQNGESVFYIILQRQSQNPQINDILIALINTLLREDNIEEHKLFIEQIYLLLTTPFNKQANNDVVKKLTPIDLVCYLGNKHLLIAFYNLIERYLANLDKSAPSAEDKSSIKTLFNPTENQECTPLHYAILGGQLDIVHWLCEEKVIFNCSETSTISPAQVARFLKEGLKKEIKLFEIDPAIQTNEINANQNDPHHNADISGSTNNSLSKFKWRIKALFQNTDMNVEEPEKNDVLEEKTTKDILQTNTYLLENYIKFAKQRKKEIEEFVKRTQEKYRPRRQIANSFTQKKPESITSSHLLTSQQAKEKKHMMNEYHENFDPNDNNVLEIEQLLAEALNENRETNVSNKNDFTEDLKRFIEEISKIESYSNFSKMILSSLKKYLAQLHQKYILDGKKFRIDHAVLRFTCLERLIKGLKAAQKEQSDDPLIIACLIARCELSNASILSKINKTHTFSDSKLFDSLNTLISQLDKREFKLIKHTIRPIYLNNLCAVVVHTGRDFDNAEFEATPFMFEVKKMITEYLKTTDHYIVADRGLRQRIVEQLDSALGILLVNASKFTSKEKDMFLLKQIQNLYKELEAAGPFKHQIIGSDLFDKLKDILYPKNLSSRRPSSPASSNEDDDILLQPLVWEESSNSPSLSDIGLSSSSATPSLVSSVGSSVSSQAGLITRHSGIVTHISTSAGSTKPVLEETIYTGLRLRPGHHNDNL